MNHEHHLELLESVAESYDLQFNVRNKNRGFQRPEKRAVYNHFLDGYDESVDDHDHDINTSIYEILANAHSRVPGSTMSKEQWDKLDSKAQQLWDTLAGDIKSCHSHQERSNSSPPSVSVTPATWELPYWPPLSATTSLYWCPLS